MRDGTVNKSELVLGAESHNDYPTPCLVILCNMRHAWMIGMVKVEIMSEQVVTINGYWLKQLTAIT